LLLVAIAPVTLAQPAFDVASVKEVLDFVPGIVSEKIIVNPGNLTMRNVRLRACIKWAYDVKDYEIAGPAWMPPGQAGRDVGRYEILAKASPDTPIAQMRLMLQRVLTERFKITSHRETKEMPVYMLTVIKPSVGFQRSADQDAEASIVPGPEGIRFLAYPIADFAEFLAAILRFPVLTGPGLAGRYDITMKNPPGDNAEEELSNLTSAMRQQLGLALEKRKASIEMLIVDSAEKHPVAN
jgi:uncharacterized protein (TIGR03435 family)